MQDLIDSSRLLIAGVNDEGNNSITPPNQNLQIFTDPMPKHNISFVKSSETSKNDVMNVDTNDKNMDKIQKTPMDTTEKKSYGKMFDCVD